MNPFIAIRATGLITPLGHNVAATWRALVAGQFIRTHARVSDGLDSSYCEGWLGSSVEGRRLHDAGCEPTRKADCPHPNPLPEYRERGPDTPRVDRLGVLAGGEAVSASGDATTLLADSRTALVVGTSKGAADEWLDSPAMTRSFGLGALTDHLAAALGHGIGPRLTLSGACASGLHALIRAAMLIEHGDADRALVVAAESSMHPLFLQSFRRMGVLPPEDGRCRPFDVNRQGLLVSEAAAAVVLVKVDEPQPGDILIDRCAFAGDAAHLTGFEPNSATIRRVLATVVDGRPVDVIHAHGTGTIENDAAEVTAIDSVLGEMAAADRAYLPPAIYSHKGAIGHSLGASGMVSVVLNVMMQHSRVVPPSVGIETPMQLRHATLSRETIVRRVERSVICAAGFGGATAAVSLRGM